MLLALLIALSTVAGNMVQWTHPSELAEVMACMAEIRAGRSLLLWVRGRSELPRSQTSTSFSSEREGAEDRPTSIFSVRTQARAAACLSRLSMKTGLMTLWIHRKYITVDSEARVGVIDAKFN